MAITLPIAKLTDLPVGQGLQDTQVGGAVLMHTTLPWKYGYHPADHQADHPPLASGCKISIWVKPCFPLSLMLIAFSIYE